MTFKLRNIISITTVYLLVLVSCNQNEKPSPPVDQELVQLRQEYLHLQKNHRELQSKLASIKQENELLKTGINSDQIRDKDLQTQLKLSQKNLNARIHEYRSLQKDYAALEASITPLAKRNKASILALRNELIGTQLGTVVLKNGRQLHQSEIEEITDHSLRLKFADGSIEVAFAQLPPPIQERFFYNPLLVSPEAMLSESPDTEKSDPAHKNNIDASSLIREAFAERNRQELAQFNLSIQQKIPELEQKIGYAKQQIINLKKDRSVTVRKFNSRSGNIKRSPVDRDKALREIDTEIRRLETAIQVAKIQITSWQKELDKNKSEDK